MARRALPLTILAVALVVAVVVARGLGDSAPRLRAAFAGAVNLVPGNEVRLAGRKVGEVASVDEVDGEAVVELKIEDGRVWPLPRGTSARIRYGSTSSYASRYVEVAPGPRSAPRLRDGDVLARADTVTPVEFDDFFGIFDRPTRRSLRGLVTNLADTVDGRQAALRDALRRAPGGLDASADVLRELGADEHALRTLVVAGDRTSAAVAAREPQLRELIAAAASTFDALADHAAAQRASLERFPRTLATGRATLARFDRSLTGLDALVGDLRPGARELRRLAAPTRRALSALREVAPLTASTLRRGRRAAPSITRFMGEATGFLPRLGGVLDELAPMVACVRPYAPEMGGYLASWAAALRNYDRRSHYMRGLRVRDPSAIPGTDLNSKQIVDATGGRIRYAMPRPPGLNAEQPWLQPGCGAGRDALDPGKDPEGAGR